MSGLEIALLIGVFILLVIDFFAYQHINTRMKHLSIITLYNIQFFSEKFEDYGQPTKEQKATKQKEASE